jgi:uncharacterized protein YndB with AHSA1/START domain
MPMAAIRAAAERTIAAPPDLVYRLIADYREQHFRFLPPAFSDWRIEQGGVGTGTVARFRLTLGGRGRDYRALVAEPEPGRVLTETDQTTGAVTTFRVLPADGQSRVRIETVWRATGISGLIERLLAPRLLRRLYADELDRLARAARELASRGG